MLKITIEEMKELTLAFGRVSDGELEIRLDSTTLKGYRMLKKIGKAVLRPVKAFGSVSDNGAYLWLSIPLAKTTKAEFCFDNDPPARKKAGAK